MAAWLKPCPDTNRSGQRELELATALILRHLRIHTIGPRGNSAGQIVDFRESGLLQKGYGLGAAATHFAVGDDFAARIELVDALGQIVQRNQMTVEVANLIFVRLAHVENE